MVHWGPPWGMATQCRDTLRQRIAWRGDDQCHCPTLHYVWPPGEPHTQYRDAWFSLFSVTTPTDVED